MVKAKFIGSATVMTYKTAQFDACKNNKVAMSDDTWEGIVSKGDDKLFTEISKVGEAFPAQKTVGA
jgi:hypothetical protein